MVRYDEHGSVARIVLDRPDRLNALNAAMAGQLLAALRHAAAPQVRAVLLTGAGRAFCSGSDLRENFGPGAPDTEVTLRRDRHPALLELLALRKPVVCAVNGVAAGIGVGLALACDLVLMGRGASLQLAFTRIGLGPDGGTSWMLQQAIGRARAMRAMLLGDAIDAATALDWGLVAQCVPDEELTAVADELVTRLADGPTLAYAAVKESLGGGYAERLETEARLQGALSRTADFSEGRTALLDRRPPSFGGH